MANYANIKATIDANIKQNGNEEITGPVLNSVLTALIGSLGDGYQFKGVASPATNPGAPDAKVVYLAEGHGAYTNFGNNYVYRGELGIFVGTGTSWSKISVPWGEDVARYVWASQTGTVYHDDGSVTFNTITVRDLSNNENTTYTINNTFSPLPSGGSCFVLERATGTVSVISPTDLRRHHVLLLYRTSVGTFIGGDLLADYANRKIKALGLAAVTRTIRPHMELGTFSATTGAFGNWTGRYNFRTPLIRCSSAYFLQAGENDVLEYRVIFYDKERAFLSAVGYATLPAEGVNVSVPTGTQFTALTFRKSPSGGVSIPVPSISLTGVFPQDYEAFFPRPAGGYQKLVIPVNVADPASGDAETETVQDTMNLLPDYGILALPEQYNPDGAPTRLIVYCHGAAVNYDADVSQFDPTELDPNYWLAEGCAVMDIEGNPYNNVDEHYYAPCARQSYLAAYDWVLRHYNIRKDGVYLGGRSMGGGMSLELLQSRMPVIATCTIAMGGTIPPRVWNYMTAARRQFCAEKMGFAGTAPTWTSQKPMTTAEWNYIFDTNWDKVVKYCPFWRGVECLPDREALLSPGNIVGPSQVETDLYNSMHLKVKSPIKLFAALDDATVSPANMRLYYQMLLNAAQVCELRWFPTGGHHFEMEAQNKVDSWTTTYGTTVSDVPIPYIEALQYWRRYELNF